MFFEVTFSDGTISIMQAHNKTQLGQALQGVTITQAIPKRRCKGCRKVVATVQNTLCDTCWTAAVEECRAVCKEIPMSEQELRDLVMSFFVDG